MSDKTIPAWKQYRVGAEVICPDGIWQIVECRTRPTPGGYNTRLFTLEGPSGRKVIKTARGITLFSKGIDVPEPLESAQPVITIPAPEAIQPVPAPAPGVVRHACHEALLRIVRARVNAWLVGPAGSGKTSAAEAVAQDLGLPFYSKSVGPQTSESSLLGYQDANGNTVRTLLREAFEGGGVFLLDEVDAANPSVLVVINALLANGSCAFPDKVVQKHKDFVLIAGANTVGTGKDQQYVGRQQIDAASLDRFVMVPWDYDPAIEAAVAGVSLEAVAGASRPKPYRFDASVTPDEIQARCEQYVRYVVNARNACASFSGAMRFIVSPRASKHGAALIRQGFSVADACDLALWKGLGADDRRAIQQRMAA